MEYMLMIVEEPADRAGRSVQAADELQKRMEAFGGELAAEGKLLSARSLKSPKSATRISSRTGRQSINDGPFAEAKEFIGGYFLIDCADHAAAMAIAQRCPAAEWATVELRPVGACSDG